MIVNLYHMTVQPESIEAFNEVGIYNLQTSLENESGTRLMIVAQEEKQPDSYWILEIYESEEAYAIHRSSPQFQYFVTNGAPLITQRKQISVTPLTIELPLITGSLTTNALYLTIYNADSHHMKVPSATLFNFRFKDIVAPDTQIAFIAYTSQTAPLQPIGTPLKLISGFYH